MDIEKELNNISIIQNRTIEAAKELFKEIDNLQCCGNCKNFQEDIGCKPDNVFKKPAACSDFCPSWQFDGLTQKERTIEK